MTSDVNEILNVQEPSGRPDSSAEDFWAFKKMITPFLIQVLFWIGAAICLVGGLAIISGARDEYRETWDGAQVARGFICIVLGPVLVRIYCEFLILFFRMNETLTEIENRLK